MTNYYKMKRILIRRSMYGGLECWINGKLRHSSDNDIIDLPKMRGHVQVRLILEYYSNVVKVLQEGTPVLTANGTGTFETVDVYQPHLPLLQTHLRNLSLMIHLHWKEALGIAGSIGSILGTLKTFGFLNCYRN